MQRRVGSSPKGAGHIISIKVLSGQGLTGAGGRRAVPAQVLAVVRGELVPRVSPSSQLVQRLRAPLPCIQHAFRLPCVYKQLGCVAMNNDAGRSGERI
jgi:hypothetical protein